MLRAKIEQHGRSQPAAPVAPQPKVEPTPPPEAPAVESSGSSNQDVTVSAQSINDAFAMIDDEPTDDASFGGNASPPRPDYYWTWRLLRDGYAVGECAIIRSVEQRVVFEHAILAIEAGEAVERSWFGDTIEAPGSESIELLDMLRRVAKD
jgi:hypothetical protein